MMQTIIIVIKIKILLLSMANHINFGYQQSQKGTETTANNLSQVPNNDHQNNITELYKQDSVSSDPVLDANHNQKNQAYNLNFNQDQQHNQLKIFMKKADKLNQTSYRKLHEVKPFVPQSSTINVYKSSKNILDEFNLPTQRDRKIKQIYLKRVKDVKRRTKNDKFRMSHKANTLHKKSVTDSKFVQTQTLNVETRLADLEHFSAKTDRLINKYQSQNKKIKKTLKAIQQDEDQQSVPVKRKSPANTKRFLFNTIQLAKQSNNKFKVDANSYLHNLAKAQHDFNRSVKRYSLREEYQQTTIFNESDKSTSSSNFWKPTINKLAENPWQSTIVQNRANQDLLPIIKQKSSVKQNSKKFTEINEKIHQLQLLPQSKQNVRDSIEARTQNSLFVENNNSQKRSRVYDNDFTSHLQNSSINNAQFNNKNNRQIEDNSPKKQVQKVQKVQNYVQAPQVYEIAIGTETNNFVMGSKAPIHPINISFGQKQTNWITSQYQPKSQFMKNIDMTNFNIKKYRNGVYFGQLSEDHTKHGKGVIFYFNGRSYEGNFQSDMKQGKGFQYMPDGSFYSGDFQKGLKHGRGIYQWTNGQVYDGQWQAGKKTGSGMWKTPKGDSYIGQWLNNKIQGFGVLTISSGDRYQGQFKDSMKNGLGTQRYSNGDTYVGQFVKNRPNGQGQYYYRNGDVYKGFFSNGLKHGNGYLKAGGETYQGQFRNQKKCGYGQLQNQQGVIYKGNFQNNLKHGYGQQKCQTHGLIKGYWINGNNVQDQMGSIQQDQLDRQQSIVNLKNKKQIKGKNLQGRKSNLKRQVKKELSKSPQMKRQKSLSPSDPNFQRACGCRRKH